MIKKFKEFINETVSYEDTKNREAITDIIRRYLHPWYADVLLMKFGLYTTDEEGETVEFTDEEIAEYLGLTKERVKKMFNRAIENLKKIFDDRYDSDDTYETPYDDELNRLKNSPYSNPRKGIVWAKRKWMSGGKKFRDRDKRVLLDLLSGFNDNDMGIDDDDLNDLNIQNED